MQRLVVLFWIVSSAFVLRAETVLVLPFSNQSNSTNNSTNVDWIGESISEAVRESLVSEGVLALERCVAHALSGADDCLSAAQPQSHQPTRLRSDPGAAGCLGQL